MAGNYFRWQWPDGEVVIAKWAEKHHISLLNWGAACPKGKTHHSTFVMMDITQWGFDGHRWIAIHECRHCHERWAVAGAETYTVEDT